MFHKIVYQSPVGVVPGYGYFYGLGTSFAKDDPGTVTEWLTALAELLQAMRPKKAWRLGQRIYSARFLGFEPNSGPK